MRTNNRESQNDQAYLYYTSSTKKLEDLHEESALTWPEMINDELEESDFKVLEEIMFDCKIKFSDRQIFLRYYKDKQTVTELAKTFRCNKGTISRRIQRTRNHIYHQLRRRAEHHRRRRTFNEAFVD
jgi:DNA-directed RNA polymerase specialized sigma24 family protein